MSVGVEDRYEFTAELPLLLKVEEAAAVLRIGRTLAYSLARRYEESGGVDGLAVIRLGGCLRVPRRALLELACTGRVVALSELAVETADFLSRIEDEPPVQPSEELHELAAVEQSASPKPKREKRSAVEQPLLVVSASSSSCCRRTERAVVFQRPAVPRARRTFSRQVHAGVRVSGSGGRCYG